MNLDSARKVKLFRLRLGSLVPFLQDFRECSPVDFDELLELVEIVAELLEAFLKGSKLCGASRGILIPRLKDLLLV